MIQVRQFVPHFKYFGNAPILYWVRLGCLRAPDTALRWGHTRYTYRNSGVALKYFACSISA
jgi:hypothetical protein